MTFINCIWISRINILLLFGSFILLYNLYWFSFADIIIQFQLLYIFSVKTFFLKVRLLLDYSDLNKNLSNLHKIAILWSYCSHKFSPIPIKLLLLFVEIDHHIQYLWFMQLVWKFSVNDLLEASCILPPKECIPF